MVDELASRCSIHVSKNERGTLTGVGKLRNKDVVLVKPQTFMNNSGAGVSAVLNFRNLTNRDLIVVHDELDLPWTALRIKEDGSAAGHNGVKSVIAALKTDVFIRVRVGIRPDHPIADAAEYVLAPLEREMKQDVAEIVSYTADAIETIVAEGAVKAMTKFNRRASRHTTRGQMRIYEELFIVRPDATEEEVDPLIEQLKNVITQTGGTLDKTEKWGVRKLAYRVLKYNEAQYILLQFTAKPETVKEVQRRLRVADLVMKHITVRIDEKLKRIEKRKKAREKRAARKPPPTAPTPAMVSPLLPSEGPASSTRRPGCDTNTGSSPARAAIARRASARQDRIRPKE